MGQFGRGKTFATLYKNYFWPKMLRNINRFTNRCSTCHKAKSKAHPIAFTCLSQFHINHGKTLAWISYLDCLGLVMERIRYLLLWTVSPRWHISFLATRYTMLHMLIISFVGKYCVSMVCQRLSSRTTTSSSLATLKDPMRQARNQATLLHGIPSSNRRQREVTNRTLSALLRVLIKKNIKEWEECLPIAEFAYNRARHLTTGKSPFEVVYRFNPLSPLDILPLPLQERINLDASARATHLKKVHEDTRNTIERQVHTTKKYTSVMIRVCHRRSLFCYACTSMTNL